MSFTIKELREMTRLRGCTLRADPQAFGGVEEVLPGSGEGLGVVGGALWEGLSGG